MGNNKIFIGFNNIASQIPEIKESFKINHKIECLTAVYDSGSSIISSKDIDYDIAAVKRKLKLFNPQRIGFPVKEWWDNRAEEKIWKRALRECHTFIFIVDSFKKDHQEFETLKQKRKKIIQVFVGDDARWYNAMKQEFEIYKMRPIEYKDSYHTSLAHLEDNLCRIRMAEKYADAIFSRQDQGQIQLKPFYRWNMMVVPSLYSHKPEQRKNKPVIVHAPSSSEFKGTRFILEAIEKLKGKVDFEFKLIQNMPREEALKAYGEGDILIDQVLCPGTGKIATEALASGTIVLSLMNYEKYPQKNPEDCPVIDVNPDTIYDVLLKIIPDHEFRRQHALKGRPYVEKYLDVRYFTEKVVKIMEGSPPEFDYHPDFFRNEFKPKSKQEEILMNYWNYKLKDEPWYKKNIEAGERDGLIF
ncbi:MAG TPA: hypothetical protein VN026_14260 [Bacteroidia bacterium]|jgi:glycosyltransferase involved in cell wall biosynthesis|nr:hypothetical protein [Bacteroidia bacterium]